MSPNLSIFIDLIMKQLRNINLSINNTVIDQVPAVPTMGLKNNFIDNGAGWR